MTADDLRQSLAAAGVTQMELARRLGIDGRTVRYWMAGRPIAVSDEEIHEALKPRQTVCPACGHRWQPSVG